MLMTGEFEPVMLLMVLVASGLVVVIVPNASPGAALDPSELLPQLAVGACACVL